MLSASTTPPYKLTNTYIAVAALNLTIVKTIKNTTRPEMKVEGEVVPQSR